MSYRHSRSSGLSPRPTRPSSGYDGLFFDSFATDSAWIRDQGYVRIPPLQNSVKLRIHGEIRPHPEVSGLSHGWPSLTISVEGGQRVSVRPEKPGPWETHLDISAEQAQRGIGLRFTLHGVSLTNTLAWAGRILGLKSLQRFRGQPKNRQLRVVKIETNEGETVYDFSDRHAPFSPDFARKHLKLGLNIAGFLTADLGVGESARCMVRAADATSLPTALIDLKLHSKNPRGDTTYAPRLVDAPVHEVNVVHIDAPASLDVETHHGTSFRAGRYQIGYWAWELPEFPDAWMRYFAAFDEIWCPSEFVRSAIGFKSPVPVIAMPHAIAFHRPDEDLPSLRRRFNLPTEPYLFLFVYDLNSYSERKNPRAVIEAFRRSGVASRGARLVMKVHNTRGNERDLELLKNSLADLPDTILITHTLSRNEVYSLQAACNCFVSLHRAEGFGLSVAECMYLGKPVITTDWSATTEFADASCALPVRARLVSLTENHGPYGKGQIWADPDVNHAADHMRRLVDDPSLGEKIGIAARQRIETQLSPLTIGTRYRRRLEAIFMRSS